MDSLDLFKNPKEHPQSYLIGFVISLILMVFVPSIAFIGLNGYIAIYDSSNYPNLTDQASDFYNIIMNEGGFFLQTIGYVLVSGVFICIFYTLIKEDFIKFISSWKKNLIVIVTSFILMYLVTELTKLIFDALEFIPTSANQDTIVQALKSESFIYITLSVVFLAPFIEEMIFRKLFFGCFESHTKFPKIVIILLSSIIFSLIHLSSEIELIFEDISNFKYMISFFLYFPLAFFISFSYSYTNNNIFTAVLVHMLNNLLSVIIVFLM